MKNNNNERRKFFKQIGLGLSNLYIGNESVYSFASKKNSKKQALKIGWITDLHHGLAQDALQRLQTFLDEAQKKGLDFIIQGGDFCHPIISRKELSSKSHIVK